MGFCPDGIPEPSSNSPSGIRPALVASSINPCSKDVLLPSYPWHFMRPDCTISANCSRLCTVSIGPLVVGVAVGEGLGVNVTDGVEVSVSDGIGVRVAVGGGGSVGVDGAKSADAHAVNNKARIKKGKMILDIESPLGTHLWKVN